MKFLSFVNAISSIIIALAAIVMSLMFFRWAKVLKKQNEMTVKQNELLDRQNKIMEKQLAISGMLEEKRAFELSSEQKTKRILAREGLVLIALGMLGALLEAFKIYKLSGNTMTLKLLSYNQDKLLGGALKLIVFVYPIYLFLRFIVWSVNTLKKEKLL